MRLQFLAVLAAGLLLGADDAKKEQEKLKGNWTLVSIESHRGKEEGKDAKVEFTLDKMVVNLGKGQTRTGTYKLDPSKTPKEFDLVPDDGPKKGQAMQAIYVLEGDTLKICMAEKGARPKEFKPDGATETSIVTLKRQK